MCRITKSTPRRASRTAPDRLHKLRVGAPIDDAPSLEPRQLVQTGRISAVIEPDRADRSWIPLRFAPFRFQVRSVPFRRPEMSELEIDEFIRARVTSPDIIDCVADRNDGCFRIRFPVVDASGEAGWEAEEVFPWEARHHFSAEGSSHFQCEVLAATIETVWAEMEAHLRQALHRGHCLLLGRHGSPTAVHFTSISDAAFSHYRITDWRRGVAETQRGDCLYDLHVAAPRQQLKCPPISGIPVGGKRRIDNLARKPTQFCIARYFYFAPAERPDDLRADIQLRARLRRVLNLRREPAWETVREALQHSLVLAKADLSPASIAYFREYQIKDERIFAPSV